MKEPLNSEMIKKAKRRNLWAFMAGNLLSGFGDSCINIAYMPFLYEVTNNNLFLTGLLTTLAAVLWFLPTPILGRISDKNNRKQMMIFSKPIAFVGVFLLLFVNQNNLYLLIISIILRSVGFMSSNLNYNILVSESNGESKEGLGHIFSKMAFLYFASTIGGAVFVNLTGFEYNIYFMIFLVICIINWIKNIIFVTDTKSVQNEKIVKKSSNSKSWREVIKSPKIKTAMIFLTFDIFFWEISNSVLTAGLISAYGFTLEELAFFNIWFNVSMIIFQIPAGKLTDKFGKKKILIISELGGIFIFTLHIISSIIWTSGYKLFLFPSMILIQILSGIVVASFIPSESIILTDLDKDRKGESYGMVSFVRGFGAMFPGAIGGFLMGTVHFITPFIVTTIGIVLLIIYLLKFGHRFEEIDEIGLNNKKTNNSKKNNSKKK
ncbi:MFS transporter [Promethearchaeum syntrophicum]|uniref:MFS transporter n=1 Tax=Promethearchaeum syntrophicum TaxID=2594042 RepID=A0A5B9D5Y1_9ARCH|nr:MFS transporter [Candidatus Prometheoarchaeum syntrophicum]QEE14386.1 putative 3-hydroxyphenylpropionic transporter MhpT [Candidatus Prometheoarchaeum syntrophicum]